MQELEKIFEEIDAHAIEFEAFGASDDYISVGWVKDIIRRHLSRENVQETARLSRDNEVTECCPHCDREITVLWDVEQDGYQIFCPNCGKTIMLCSMCDREPCDWTENGCKYSDERYRDYFRKHMNDGWIPVQERLPEEKKSVLVQWEKYDRHLNVKLTYLDVMWLDDAEEKVFETINGVPNGKVIAWRPLPEPYRPERSSYEKE